MDLSDAIDAARERLERAEKQLRAELEAGRAKVVKTSVQSIAEAGFPASRPIAALLELLAVAETIEPGERRACWLLERSKEIVEGWGR